MARAIPLSNARFERQFDELVTGLHKKTGKKVVLLIDEYDKPLLNTLETGELANVKSAMNAFYAMVKSLDEHLRFVFVTGVSKFSKVSVFSGMNNLNDISLDKAYATLCGYTKAEIIHYFDNSVAALSQLQNADKESTYQQIEQWYNGYTFSQGDEGVYNPSSILSLLEKQRFENYWFQSATPTFLINLLKSQGTPLSQIESVKVGDSAFYAVEPEHLDIYAVLLQTGYLTIKSYQAPLYCLGFPNKEVRDSFYESLTAHYAAIAPSLTKAYAIEMHTLGE